MSKQTIRSALHPFSGWQRIPEALAAIVLLSFASFSLLVVANGPGVAAQDGGQPTLVVGIGTPAPEITFTALGGAHHTLSEFKGRPVMLWFFASWCPSCIAGTEEVVRNFKQLEADGLQIIQLRLYNNLGYAGLSAKDFAQKYAGAVITSPNWLWGEASWDASVTYDPRGYPDIYFLIDETGVIRVIEGLPHVTINEIEQFVREAERRKTELVE